MSRFIRAGGQCAILVLIAVMNACGGGGGSSPASGGTMTSGPTSTTPAPTVKLTAAPASIASGGTSILTWSSTGATSCTASGGWSGSLAISGTETTAALTSNTTYTLACTGTGGTTSASANVAVAAASVTAPTVTLTPNPVAVNVGAASTLTWSSTGATSCSAGDGWSGTKTTSGSQSTGALSAATTYTLACTGAGGTTSTSVTVSVSPANATTPPTVSLSSSPATVASGATATLSWSSMDATSCTASGGWTGTKATSGTVVTGALTATTTYTLACSGSGGTTTTSRSVTIAGAAAPPAPTVSLTSNPADVASGAAATLTWTSANATACAAAGGWTGAKATSGTQSSGALSATTGFTLACTGAGGSASASTAVTVVPVPTVTVTPAPASVQSGATSTLTWTSTNATACTASGGWTGAKPTSGTSVTAPLTATTQYDLACSGTGGTGSAAATVNVLAMPTVTLTASSASAASGTTVILTWSSTHATTCTAGGGWTGAKAISGSSTTAAITANTTYTLSCTGSGGTASASTMVTVTNTTTYTVTPHVAPLTLTQSQQFTAANPGGGTTAWSWSVDNITGGNATVGTISATGLYVPPATPGTHTVLATNTADLTRSGAATVAVTDLAGIYTYHYDTARTGQNLKEYALTPASVGGGTFGKRWACPVDDSVFAQPLYVANLSIGGGVHNVLIVATQHNSIYAFDADNVNTDVNGNFVSCVTYWQVSLNGVGETNTNYLDLNNCNDITNVGITGTPVIDPATNTLYAVAATKNPNASPTAFYQRLHAISITTGADKVPPFAISANAADAPIYFDPLWQNQRSGLAFYNGEVFVSWAAHCDEAGHPWWGWLMKYEIQGSAFAKTGEFNVAPNNNQTGAVQSGKGGIWMSGGAPALDSGGNMFLSTGNGTFTNDNTNYSMSFLNMSPATLSVQDFYTPSLEGTWSTADLDVSASGVTVIPDGMGPSAHPNLLVGSDKQAHLWSIDRASMMMGGFSATGENTVQYLMLPTPTCTNRDKNCIFGTPAYYNQTVYVVPVSAAVMALPLVNGLFQQSTGAMTTPPTAATTSTSAEIYKYPGATPSVSASPTGSGIVWVLDNSGFANTGNSGTTPASAAFLRAYDAGNLGNKLYDSTAAAASADQAGPAVKYTSPVVANGHVYIGGVNVVTVYGLSP